MQKLQHSICPVLILPLFIVEQALTRSPQLSFSVNLAIFTVFTKRGA
jgi:hypothetical protein